MYGGLHEATSIKPNTEEPGVVTAETPHVPDKITKTAPEPKVPLSGHQTGPVYRPNLVASPQQAATVEENGEAANVPTPNEQPETVSAPIEQTPEATPGERQDEPDLPVAQTPEPGRTEAQPQPSAPALPNWEDLSPEERASQTAQVKTGFLRAYQKFKPYFDALGVSFLENPYSEAAIATQGNGNMELWVGPERLAGIFNEYRQKGSQVPSFHTILQHELIHAAWISVQRQRWALAGKREDFNTFRRREAAALTSDVQNKAATL